MFPSSMTRTRWFASSLSLLVLLAAAGRAQDAEAAQDLRATIPQDLVIPTVPPPAAEVSPQLARLILLRADQSRGNLDGIAWEVLVSSEGARSTEYDVKARGYDFVARTQKPARHKGDTVLMVSNNMWFHKKLVSKPVPISQRQKLLGSAAYGDIAATNYAEDFQVVEVTDDRLGDEDCWALRLQRKPDRKTTYDKLKVWVSKARVVSVQTEHYTVSGKLIKTTRMDYALTVPVDGETRPFISAIHFQDALLSKDTTRMDLSRPRLKRVPRSAFDLNLLRR